MGALGPGLLAGRKIKDFLGPINMEVQVGGPALGPQEAAAGLEAPLWAVVKVEATEEAGDPPPCP